MEAESGREAEAGGGREVQGARPAANRVQVSHDGWRVGVDVQVAGRDHGTKDRDGRRAADDPVSDGVIAHGRLSRTASSRTRGPGDRRGRR